MEEYADYKLHLQGGEPGPFRARNNYSNDKIAWELPIGGAFPLPETFFELMTPAYTGYKLSKSKENLTELEAKEIEQRFLVQKFFFSLFLGFFSAYLAYTCNYVDDGWFSGTFSMRWIYTIIAFLLPGIYLLYYVMVHVIGDSVLVASGLLSSCLPMAKQQLSPLGT